MKITNKAGLPEALVNAIRHDDYDPGECDISVTQLVNPPQIKVLREQYDDQIEEDAADRIWLLLGKSIHQILENAGEVGLIEERLFAERNGYTISGQIDQMALDSNRITDFKVTSVWTYVLGMRDTWINQLNVYAWLARENGLDVDELEICAMYRDWSRTRSLRSRDYPDIGVKRLPVPLWNEQYCEDYLDLRLKMHFGPPPIPPCTDEDRWAKPEQWAVMKKGRKSALRVLESKSLAVGWAMEKGHCAIASDNIAWATGYYLEERPREYTRCEHYCEVAPFCDQWFNTPKIGGKE